MALIEREAAKAKKVYCEERHEYVVPVAALDWLSTVDVAPVAHGRWIHDINNLYGCSECMKRETMSPKKLKPYCPNCGCKMQEE